MYWCNLALCDTKSDVISINSVSNTTRIIVYAVTIYKLIIIIIMVIFKCYLSGELIALS